ncbi:hypothetical protein SAMN05216505_105184 [Streptomyces prasinopilosus]|uniref:Uncharacterized protein n=1 Tax=Streptomyces prasinopilosus TaxID=67344 RepID=A0A1G6S5D7_9ACTN|nr:hypothetical protein SAMN05216505_105184 [Streptomyces prasinopilosus]
MSSVGADHQCDEGPHPWTDDQKKNREGDGLCLLHG